MEQLVILLLLAFWIYVWIRVVGKTGNNQWLGLLMMVPIANVILLIWLAFSEWPIERRAARQSSEDSGHFTS